MLGLALALAAVSGTPQVGEYYTPTARYEDTQVLHLDVLSLGDAEALKKVVQLTWPHDQEWEKIIIEPVRDGHSRMRYCVKISRYVGE